MNTSTGPGSYRRHQCSTAAICIRNGGTGRARRITRLMHVRASTSSTTTLVARISRAADSRADREAPARITTDRDNGDIPIRRSAAENRRSD